MDLLWFFSPSEEDFVRTQMLAPAGSLTPSTSWLGATPGPDGRISWRTRAVGNGTYVGFGPVLVCFTYIFKPNTSLAYPTHVAHPRLQESASALRSSIWSLPAIWNASAAQYLAENDYGQLCGLLDPRARLSNPARGSFLLAHCSQQAHPFVCKSRVIPCEFAHP